MHRPVHRVSRFAVVATLAATLALVGCGRKGLPDPPPTADLTTPQPATPRPSLGEDSFNSPSGSDREAPAAPANPTAAAAAPKKTFFLDFLIGK